MPKTTKENVLPGSPHKAAVPWKTPSLTIDTANDPALQSIFSFRARLDTFLCSVCALPKISGLITKYPDALEAHEAQLRKAAAEFTNSHTNDILSKAIPYVQNVDVAEIKAAIHSLDPLVSAELLMAIEDNPMVITALKSAFFQGLNMLNPHIACSLLYAIRITGNVKSLSDKRMLLPHVARFLNALDSERAYQWCASIGYSANVDALTSATVLDDYITRMPSADANFAGYYSLLVGFTGKTHLLSDGGLADFLNGLPPGKASKLMAGFWCTNATTLDDNMARLNAASSFNDIIAHAASRRQNSLTTADAPHMLLVRAASKYDQHDLGIMTVAKFLHESGVDFVYEDIIDDPEIIVDIVQRRGIRAIAFGLAEDSYRDVIVRTSELLRARGLPGVHILAGGMASKMSIRELRDSGVRFLAGPSAQYDMLNIIQTHSKEGPCHPNTAWLRAEPSATPHSTHTDIEVPSAIVHTMAPSGMQMVLLVTSADAVPLPSILQHHRGNVAESHPSPYVPQVNETKSATPSPFEASTPKLRSHPRENMTVPSKLNNDVKPTSYHGPVTIIPPVSTVSVSSAAGIALSTQLSSVSTTSVHKAIKSETRKHGVLAGAKVENLKRRRNIEMRIGVSDEFGPINAESRPAIESPGMKSATKGLNGHAFSIASAAFATVATGQFIMHGNAAYAALALVAFSIAGSSSLIKERSYGEKSRQWISLKRIKEKIGSAIRTIALNRRASKMRSILRKAERAEALASELLEQFSIPQKVKKDYYQALNISRTGDQKRIRDAYITLIKKHHPDVSREKQSESKAKELNEAYQVLSDTNAKRDYDLLLSDSGPAANTAEANRIAERIIMEYDADRNAEYDAFVNSIQNSGMSTQEFFYRVEYFIDWRKTFDGTIHGMFGKFFTLGKEIRSVKLGAERLSGKMEDKKSRSRLERVSSEFDSTMERYKAASDTVAAAIKRARREIAKAEKKTESSIRSQIY